MRLDAVHHVSDQFVYIFKLISILVQFCKLHLSASSMVTHSPDLRSQAKRWPQSEPDKMKSFPHQAASCAGNENLPQNRCNLDHCPRVPVPG